MDIAVRGDVNNKKANPKRDNNTMVMTSKGTTNRYSHQIPSIDPDIFSVRGSISFSSRESTAKGPRI